PAEQSPYYKDRKLPCRLHSHYEVRGDGISEEHELSVVDGRSAQRVRSGDLVQFQAPDVDVAEGDAFALEHPDTAARKSNPADFGTRSEEHTSELQSRFDLVCRLLLEKKKKK